MSTARRTGKTALILGLEPGVVRSVTGLPIYVIPLGYERPPLSLNDRGSWRTKARKTRELRVRVAWRARQVKAEQWPHIHVLLSWVPADMRHRDPDNLIGTLKPCIDALTAAGQARGWPCTPMVPDDTPEHVSWSPPRILEPDEHGPRLWLTVTALAHAPVQTFGLDLGSDQALEP